MSVTTDKVFTAIVLQGGGALGAYEYGVLTALYEARPGFKPVAVSGISIGAITAAVLGGNKDPISALDTLWRDKLTVEAPLPLVGLPAFIDQSLAVFGNPGMYRMNGELLTAPWKATSIYDTAPLRQTLSELVDPQVLKDQETRVLVGATRVDTGEIEYFDSHRRGGLTYEHVAASGSLPPSFPMTKIEGRSYWDGGLFSNTPLSPAINALEEAAKDDACAVLELIVVELFPMKAPIPNNLLEVQERMGQLQYASRLKLDQHFFEEIDQFVDLMAKIDEGLKDHPEILEDPAYQRLRRHRKINHFNVVTSDLPPSCPTQRTSRTPLSRRGSKPDTTTPWRRGSVPRARQDFAAESRAPLPRTGTWRCRWRSRPAGAERHR
jgi:NTE family protein